MYSLQVLKEYRDAIYELCSSLPKEVSDFFISMEEKGINVQTDTIGNRIENINVIYSHCIYIGRIADYIHVNQNLEYERDFCEALPESLIMTPLQVFEILVARSTKIQEEVVKLSCEQHLMSRIMSALRERNVDEFLSIVESNKVDMANVSKLLSVYDIPQFSENDDDLFEFWYNSLRGIFGALGKLIDPQLDLEMSLISKAPLFRWLFESLFSDEEFNKSNIIALFPEKIKRYQELLQYHEEGDEKTILEALETYWIFQVKRLIIAITNLPETIAKRIRGALSPFYFRPLIERFEREWEDIQREQHMFVERLEHDFGSQSEDFSLYDNFFTQKNDSLSFHMNLHPGVVKVGVKKFEDFLRALAAEGYVDKSALPLLAFRLTGCGTPFDEEIIIWHKDPRVIRYIIANMHEEGVNWVSKLDKYFIDENGNTFLNKITAAKARNIKKLYIFKRIIKPYYGKVLTLP